MPDRPSANLADERVNIELNPCSGGMALGFKRAGIEFDAAFDWDPDACESYERNIGHRPIRMDIRDLGRLVRDGMFSPQVKLLVADPPCTPWSTAGNRKGMEDERDLLAVTVDIIERLKPHAWLVGNVPGLDTGDNWRNVVQPVVGGMAKRAGYCVDYAQLDAADFGVPQHRRRPFWFGHPVGTACIQWPYATHGDHSTQRLDGRKPWVTVGKALAERLGPDPSKWGRHVRLRKRRGERAGKKPRASRSDEPAGVVTSRENQGDGTVMVFGGKGDHRPTRLDEPGKSMTKNTHGDGAVVELQTHPRHMPSRSDRPGNVVSTCKGGGAKQAVELLGEFADRPATVIATNRDELTSPGRHDPAVAGDGNSGVLLSEEARACLQGFPPVWHFVGKTKKSRSSQIGQAMPPPMAQAVAESIVRWMNHAEDAA